ncbi:MAG: metallophosphoesterase [Candidatus Methanofastidiosia archaeon]|jgi:DNA repair exonuclease SbcCD nuclease subunit
MKILHTADIHIREYGGERWKTLEKLIEIGKMEEIEIFVISGDLFDKDIDAEKLRPKIREIFSNTGFIKIIIIPGNHDSDSYSGGKYFGRDVKIFSDSDNCFEYEDVSIWGMPFETINREEILIRLNKLADNLSSDKKNILLYHGELLDACFSPIDLGNEGEKRYMPVKLSYFNDLNIDYILAGHFHSHFDFWKLKNGGYFIYPGSPISITQKETGQRKVNIFEVGEQPKDYLLETPHYKEIFIEFNPFEDKKPLEVVENHLKNIHPNARVILTIKGFINSEIIGMNETQLVEQIEKLLPNKWHENFNPEFMDIKAILEDDLFKKFIEKLEKTNFEKEKKKQMINIAIKAMGMMSS